MDTPRDVERRNVFLFFEFFSENRDYLDRSVSVSRDIGYKIVPIDSEGECPFLYQVWGRSQYREANDVCDRVEFEGKIDLGLEQMLGS